MSSRGPRRKSSSRGRPRDHRRKFSLKRQGQIDREPDPATTVAVLLKLHGRTFAEDLGIDARRNEPSPLFCLLISALLFSTRISHHIASKSACILFERGLRAAAERDPARERTLLDEFKGVGDVAVNIFFREAQLAWPELFPFADGKALACAKKLGLPVDSGKLAGLVRSRPDFVRLVSALIRVQLEHRHDEIARLARV